MQALQIDEWGGALQLRELEEPALEPGQLRLRVLACGVGLTVVNAVDGLLARDGRTALPRVPGHEICGEVLEVGEGTSGFRPGDRVVTYFYLACNTCRYCLADRVPLCKHSRGFIGVDVDGGYAEQVVVDSFNGIPIPQGLDPVAATTIPDAVATAVHVCSARARVEPGEMVLILGAGGGVGIHMVQVARLLGARVAAVDVSEEKLATATEAGAHFTLEAGTGPDEVREVLGGAADVVVDLVGTEQSLDQALRCSGSGGRIIVLTTFPGPRISLAARDAVLGEIAVIGSKYASVAELQQAVELVAGGLVRPVVSQVSDLDGVERLHELLRSRRLEGRAAVVPAPGEGLAESAR